MVTNSLKTGLLLSTCILACACTEKPQKVDTHQSTFHVEDAPYHKTLFVNDLNFLQHEFPQEYEWARKERRGKLIELEKDTCQDDFLEYTYSLNPLPGLGELYAVNLTGDDKPEYISFMYFSPLLSWTNYGIIYNDEVEPIDTLEIHSKEGLCSISFRKLQSTDKYNIIAEWEQSISVYADAGINIYELKDDGLQEIFLTNTFFDDYQSYSHDEMADGSVKSKITKRTIEYLEKDGGVSAMQIRTTETVEQDTLLDQIHEHFWNPEKSEFDQTIVISLEEPDSIAL